MNCRLTVLPLFLLLLIALPTQAQWTAVSIDEPGYSKINGSPDGQNLVASSEYSGVWLSRDAGDTWSPISHLVTDLTPDYERALVYGVNGDTLILCGRETNRYSYWLDLKMSGDGGASWFDPLEQWGTPSSPYTGQFTFQIDQGRPETWYMAGNDWVGVSSNAGQSWTYYETENNQFDEPMFACDPVQHSYIYASTMVFDGSPTHADLYISPDAGASWFPIGLGDELQFEWINSLFVQPDGSVYVTGSNMAGDYQVVRGTNLGLNWESIDFGGIDLDSYHFFITHPFDSYTLLAFGEEYHPTMKSVDGGQSWTEVDLGIPAARGQMLDLYCNPETGVIYGRTTLQGAFRIDPPWTSVEWMGEPNAGIRFDSNVGFSADARGTLICSNRKRLYFAEGDGTDFELIHPVVSGEAYFTIQEILWNVDELLLVEVDQTSEHDGERILEKRLGLTTDLGETWEYRSLPTYQTRVHQTETGLELISRSPFVGSCYVSADTGRTWVEEERLPENTRYWVMYDNLVLATPTSSFDGQVLFSNDAGLTWTTIEIEDQFVSPSWIVSTRTPNGIAFNLQHSLGHVTEEGEFSLLAQNTGLLYAGTLVTVPVGMGDAILFGGNHQDNRLFTMSSPYENWEAAEQGNVLEPQGTGIYSLAYDWSRNRLWVSNGSSLVYRTLVLTDVESGSDPLPLNHNLITSWPNPFNAMTTVQVTLAKPGNARVAVFDLLGREVAHLYEGPMAAGQHAIKLDGSSLSSGIYFLQLETTSGVINRKVTLLK